MDSKDCYIVDRASDSKSVTVNVTRLPHHLNWGITVKGVREFADRIGFPVHYTRGKPFFQDRDQGFLEYLQKSFPDVFTCYDFYQHVSWWMQKEGLQDVSVVELLCAEGNPEVGRSEVLYSHAQSEHFEDMLWNMRHICLFPDLVRTSDICLDEHCQSTHSEFRTIYIHEQIMTMSAEDWEKHVQQPAPKAFVDVLSIRQLVDDDFRLSKVVAMIIESQHTLVALDLDNYLQRTFCLFELIESIIHGVAIKVKLTGSSDAKTKFMQDYYAGMLHQRVQCESADCRSKSDKEIIDKSIRNGVGFSFVDAKITELLKAECKSLEDACFGTYWPSLPLWFAKALPQTHPYFKGTNFALFTDLINQADRRDDDFFNFDVLFNEHPTALLQETAWSMASSEKQSDYYGKLGVSRDADVDTIKKAYKTLALRWHPDKNAGSTEAGEKFKELAEAYVILSDPDQRREYDEECNGDDRRPRRRQSQSMEAKIARTMKETRSELATQIAKANKEGTDWCFIAVAILGVLVAIWVGVR